MSPSSPPVPFRGQVYLLDFAPATGHEMTGLHPCVVVQNDIANKHSGLTIVVAVTGNLRFASLPVGVFLPAGMEAWQRIAWLIVAMFIPLTRSGLENA